MGEMRKLWSYQNLEEKHFLPGVRFSRVLLSIWRLEFWVGSALNQRGGSGLYTESHKEVACLLNQIGIVPVEHTRSRITEMENIMGYH